jgi:hypothetical protein
VVVILCIYLTGLACNFSLIVYTQSQLELDKILLGLRIVRVAISSHYRCVENTTPDFFVWELTMFAI